MVMVMDKKEGTMQERSKFLIPRMVRRQKKKKKENTYIILISV